MGQPIDIRARVTDGRGLLDGFKIRTRVSVPRASVDKYIRKYGSQISNIKIPQALKTDGKPDKVRLQIARLVLLRDKLKQKTGEDILASVVHKVAMGEATLKHNGLRGMEAVTSVVLPDLVSPSIGSMAASNVGKVGGGPIASIGRGTLIDPRLVQRPRQAGMLSGRFGATKVPGSYMVKVTATGFSPGCNTRFVRHDLRSLVVSEIGERSLLKR
jgi:hypothetical protein